MRNRKLTPYVLVLPAWTWFALFFVVPIGGMLSLSLTTGNVITGFQQTFEVGNYAEAIGTYWEQILRSLFYGGCATLVGIAVGYPMAYWIAFRGGAYKSTYLLLLLLPFFVSFVLRTISWRFFLSDNGVVLGPLKDLGLLPDGFAVLNTAPAVILGLAYNFLPFMVLPIYGALRNIPADYSRAAAICGAGPLRTFWEVTLPLAMPGIIGGFILVFLTALGYFITPALLGSPQEMMIATLISQQMRENLDWPFAAALVGVLTLIVTVITLAFSKVFRFERMLGGRA